MYIIWHGIIESRHHLNVWPRQQICHSRIFLSLARQNNNLSRFDCWLKQSDKPHHTTNERTHDPPGSRRFTPPNKHTTRRTHTQNHYCVIIIIIRHDGTKLKSTHSIRSNWHSVIMPSDSGLASPTPSLGSETKVNGGEDENCNESVPVLTRSVRSFKIPIIYIRT